MSVTSNLLHPCVSIWPINSSSLSLELNFVPMIFSVDEGSATGVDVYEMILQTYLLYDLEFTTKISVYFPFFKVVKLSFSKYFLVSVYHVSTFSFLV